MLLAQSLRYTRTEAIAHCLGNLFTKYIHVFNKKNMFSRISEFVTIFYVSELQCILGIVVYFFIAFLHPQIGYRKHATQDICSVW